MMKRAAILASIWLLASWGAAALALDLPAEPRSDLGFANPLLADVVEMTRADVPDATILAYLRVRRARLETDVTAGDLIAMRRAGVHEGIVEYIASQSGAGEDSAVTSPPSTPEAADPEAAPSPGVATPPPSPTPPDPADAAEPEQPDPGDTGLIMGVYDPIPEGGYPCWPASLAPYDCGRPIPVTGGFVARWPDAGRQARRKQTDSRSKASGDRESESADRGSDRGDRGARSGERERGGEGGGRGARAGSSGRSSGESGSHGRSSGGGSGRH